MPCASYQCNSTRRTLPLDSRTIATPFIFRQRPEPYAFRQEGAAPHAWSDSDSRNLIDCAESLELHAAFCPQLKRSANPANADCGVLWLHSSVRRFKHSSARSHIVTLSANPP